MRQFRGPHKWRRGVVVQCLGPTSYMVQVASRTLHVHGDHLIPAPEEEDNTQVTAVHPTLVPDRPTGPYAEAHNPANSLGQTPLEQPSPAPTASTPVPAPAVVNSTRVSISEGSTSSPVSEMPDLPATSARKPAAEPSQPTPPLPPALDPCVETANPAGFRFGFHLGFVSFYNAPE